MYGQFRNRLSSVLGRDPRAVDPDQTLLKIEEPEPPPPPEKLE